MEEDFSDLESANSYNTRLNNEVLQKLAKKEEPRFLSILLKNKDCLMDCMSFGLKPGSKGHFWDLEARFMYNLIHAYYQKYKTILTRTAIDSLMETIDKIGGISIDEEHKAKTRMYWDKIHGLDAPFEDYELLRDNINNRFVQWQAYEMLKEELETVVRATGNQGEIVKKTKERFLKIDGLESDKYTITLNINDGMERVMQNITRRREDPDDTPAIMTGIDGIDSMYHGFTPGTYTVITGMINGGKTTLMFNIAFNMAKAGYNVVYISLEKEAVLFFTRLLALHALVDYNRIKIGGKGDKGLSDYYYGKLMEASKDITDNIHPNLDCIQAAQGTKLSKLISEVEKIKVNKKIDVLVVDYLGVIGAETHHPTRPDLDEALTSQRLQNYGRINNFVTLTAAQLKTPSTKEIRNKSKKATADDSSNVEVNTEDLAGSKMIIADADNALAAILNSDNPPTKMFVFGTKARDDEARRTVVLDFDGKLGRVSDPVFEPGQITDVDQLVYNTEMTEEKLMSDDSLFSDDPKPTIKVEPSEIEKAFEDLSKMPVAGQDIAKNEIKDIIEDKPYPSSIPLKKSTKKPDVKQTIKEERDELFDFD